MHSLSIILITKEILAVIHLIVQIIVALVGLTLTLRTLRDVRARQFFERLLLIAEESLGMLGPRNN